MYRKQLLQAIEAFLAGTPSSLVRAHSIIRRCCAVINREEKRLTIDDIIWHFLVVALTDSVFFESQQFLRETREILLGHVVQNFSKTIFRDDYRDCFTVDEADWYAQVLSLLDFITTVPYAKIHEAAYLARQRKESWETMCAHIPEVAQALTIDEQYQQRKSTLEEIVCKSPPPEKIGNEKIYHLVLREVTSILTEISVGKSAVYFGYPGLNGPHSWYGDCRSWDLFDMTESLQWVKKALEVIAGERVLFLSWRWSIAPASDAETLILSLH